MHMGATVLSTLQRKHLQSHAWREARRLAAALRAAGLGRRMRWDRGRLVSGEHGCTPAASCRRIQASMAARSYVWPSAAVTGSRIGSRVMGQRAGWVALQQPEVSLSQLQTQVP